LQPTACAAALRDTAHRAHKGSAVCSAWSAISAGGRLKRRIDEAVKILRLDQLAVGLQCGLAIEESVTSLSEDEHERKLERVMDTARQV
jgi:5-methyltetrahydropteroyltriglutamate--homocysteine methyltransferase